ncbi:WD40/YVTN/BNR-like repeat-containing protein [Glaciecola petra]|uniref:Uncharacterized protein n=1 Tax=Glaciecola petra TaxID=3075602 RepID=A0ABU2ZSH1_9ALTE|nr:hypothetical protein [Aestuariibacter sp. P117]MDT0594529.1 hypothetical protein [Aestuariibacter sp. P117]
MYLRKAYMFASIAIILLISGCASSVNVATQISQQQGLNPEEGILTARVINTSSYSLPFNQIYIAPKEVNSAKEVKPFIAYAEDRPIGDSALFAVSLPPGEYSLSVVSSFVFRGNGYYSRAAFADPEFGVFKVEANKVTDLGTIVYYPKPEGERYANLLARVPGTAEGNLLGRYFPQYAAKANNVLSWDEDELEEDRFLTYATIAQNPLEFSDIVAAPDGSIYLLGKLGVILRYSSEDGFETLAVETDLALNSFDQNDAGARITGGHEGALFYQDPGQDWQAINIPEKVTVHHVSFYQENQFDVVYSTKNDVNIVRYNTEDLNTPSTLNTYTYRTGWDLLQEKQITEKSLKKMAKRKAAKKREIGSVFVSEKGDKREISVSVFISGQWDYFNAGDLDGFAYQPDTWEMREVEENDEEMDIILNAGMAELGIKLPGFWSWDGMPQYYTRANENATWQETATRIESCDSGKEPNAKGYCVVNGKVYDPKRKSFSFISKPWFWNAQEGLAIVSFSDISFWSGERSQETKILLTSDGGASWEESDLSLPNEYCVTIVTEIKDRILLSCDGASSDFYESTDLGESWQHIRQQQAF